MQSGFDINELLQEAQKRWLKPPEVLFILQNHEKYHITQQAPQKPPSGSLFLFNKRVLRFFRKDGYSWRKKKDGRAVGEAHERLKVGSAEALNCYYAHGENNHNFQRRSYWMLDPAYEHIVLVHYREITEGRLSSESTAELSSGLSSTFSQSTSTYTAQNPSSVSLSEFHESYQNHSSPGSIEVSSDAAIGKGIDGFDMSNGIGIVTMSSEVDVDQALRKLKLQLSLDDDYVNRYAPPDDQDGKEDEYGVLDDLSYNRYAGVLSDANGHPSQQDTGSNEEHQPHTLSRSQRIENGESLFWDRLDLSQDPLDAQSKMEEVNIPNANGNNLSTSVMLTEQENSRPQSFGADITQRCGSPFTTSSYKAFELGNAGAKDTCGPPYYSTLYTASPDFSTMLFDPSVGMPLEADASLTVAKEQRFTIREISPEWGYANDFTKVIIIGSFLCDPSECVWHCMFGNIEVPLHMIQNGVLCCQAPPHPSGKVTLCITSGNRESCSEIREFEYRDKHSTCGHCDKPEGETTRSRDELWLLVRFVKMLLSNSSLQRGEANELGVDLSSKQKSDDDSWGHIEDSLLIGGGTSSSTIDWILQRVLKDKLQQWLSSRSFEGRGLSGCSLSKDEQGIIHMIAGLGYEWALNSILGCGVGINFRDIHGWTALHWAAKFGREKMVAALVASGASTVAVTDPRSQDPIGRTPAHIAAASGHKGLAGYLSELALTNHLSSLTLEESELSNADVAAEFAVNISRESVNSSENQPSLKHTLAAVRNAAQAAARIQAAFRAHSFRKRQQRDVVTSAVSGSDDEYGFTATDIQGLSVASKVAFRNLYDHNNNAALSIQKNYRGWKGRKDFLSKRHKVVKIQAHYRGYRVRKKYGVICWAVGILDKAVLRWRRKGAGLRGFKPEPECIDEDEEDEDIVKEFRKEKVNVAIDEAVSRVKCMVESPEACQQYQRMLGNYQEAKAELQGQTSEGASATHGGVSNMDKDDIFQFP